MNRERFNPNCREWLGYKPCKAQKENLTEVCDNCIHSSPILGNSLIMEAGGLGSILRTSVVAKEMKKAMGEEYQVQWLTHEKGVELLDKIPIVVSADTFGMHVAMALRKNVISLHGSQPEQEIYLYN